MTKITKREALAALDKGGCFHDKDAIIRALGRTKTSPDAKGITDGIET